MIEMDENQFDSYQIEDDDNEVDEKDDNGKPAKNNNILLLLIEIMINPSQGWKTFRKRRFMPERVASGCFYPLTGLASVSCFAGLIYDRSEPIQDIIIGALGVFMSFFFGYFICLAFLRFFLPKDCKQLVENPFLKNMTMMMLSSLAIFYTLYSLVPMFEPIIVFLPIWTIFLISKGARFLKPGNEHRNRIICMISTGVIGAPLLIDWLFAMITPG